jgi:uncharacterized membrane protein
MPTAAQLRSTPSQIASSRLESIDILRGIVMVLMAIDHTRDFFTNIRFDPMDPAHTYPALFFTRWITHFCAPTFVFLAGTGAFLYGSRRTPGELRHFLWTRGLWLIVLELTILKFAWSFNLSYAYIPLIVIWAIGCGMLTLACLASVPARVVGWVGVAIICLHNLFDGISPEAFGRFAPLWTVAHVMGAFPIAPGMVVISAYPIVPWIGVIMAGYGFGTLFLRPPEDRNRIFLRLGLALTAAFVALRATNLYGDPLKWSVQKNGFYTLFSFLNCQKYPPSLLYTLMTLGPAILALAFLPKLRGRLAKPFLIFGRVPLFYYVLHIYLIHGLAALFATIRYGSAPWMFKGLPNTWPGTELPAYYGYGLATVYLIWFMVLVILYPMCKWFAGVKQRRRDPWLSYL